MICGVAFKLPLKLAYGCIFVMSVVPDNLRALNAALGLSGSEALSVDDFEEVPAWKENAMNLCKEMKTMKRLMQGFVTSLEVDVEPFLNNYAATMPEEEAAAMHRQRDGLLFDYQEQVRLLDCIATFLSEAIAHNIEGDALAVLNVAEKPHVRKHLNTNRFPDQMQFIRACYEATFSFSSPPH